MAKGIQELAAEMAAQFTKGKRASNGETYYFLKDGAPQWMTDVCFDSHKDGSSGPFNRMLPDDYRYEMISDSVDILSECEDEDEGREQLDGKVPIYTGQLTAWLSSNVNRAGYCDEAVAEGLSDGSDIMQTIGIGYLRELEEVFSEVRSALEAEAEKRDDLQDELDAVVENATERAEAEHRNFVVYRIFDLDESANFRACTVEEGAPSDARGLYIIDAEGNVTEVPDSEKHRP